MRRFLLSIILIALFFSLGLITARNPVNAQTHSAADLINEINLVRTNNNLVAYEIDQNLMASAQKQADYMAKIGIVTHNREDGTLLSSLGIKENIAGGVHLTVQVVVHSMWIDTENRDTILGYKFGKAGAGVAVNGDLVYYVLQTEETKTGFAAQPTTNYQDTPDPFLVSDVITATPQLDGSIFHEVQAGQALWSIAIAYNITVADIIRWNNLAPTPMIVMGNRLLVRLAPTATLSPTITDTGIPPTRTIRPSQTPVTPKPSTTITPTPSPTSPPPFSIYDMERQQRRTIGWGIAVICLIGLIFVMFSGFLRKERR